MIQLNEANGDDGENMEIDSQMNDAAKAEALQIKKNKEKSNTRKLAKQKHELQKLERKNQEEIDREEA